MFYKYRNWFIFFFIVFGLYLINYPFQFVQVPEFLSKVDKWIIFVSGILVVLGGISYFKVTRFVPIKYKKNQE